MIEKELDRVLVAAGLKAGTEVILSHMGSYNRVRVTRLVPGHCRIRGAQGMEMGDDVVIETGEGRLVEGEVVWSYLGETCIRLSGDLGIDLP
jgi:hypothetical protein